MRSVLTAIAVLVALTAPAHAAISTNVSGDCTRATARVYNLDTGFSYTHRHGPRGPFYFLQYRRYQPKVSFTFRYSDGSVVARSVTSSSASVTVTVPNPGAASTVTVAWKHPPTVLPSDRHWGHTTELAAPVAESGSSVARLACERSP
jgi:hypothetical protein